MENNSQEEPKQTPQKTERMGKMEKRIKRIEILVFVILALTILNICFTTGNMSGRNNANGEINQIDLPDYITEDNIDSIMSDIKNYYNSKNFGKLYSILGPYAKTEIKYSAFKEQMPNIENLIGDNIESFVYTYSEYIGEEDGGDFYKLYYKTSFSNGTGETDITIFCHKSDFEIVGFNFNISNFGE